MRLTNAQQAMLRRIRNFNGLLIGGAYDDRRTTKALLRAGLIHISGTEWKITEAGLGSIGRQPASPPGADRAPLGYMQGRGAA